MLGCKQRTLHGFVFGFYPAESASKYSKYHWNSPVLTTNGSWLFQFYLTENCYHGNISFRDPLALSKQNTLTRHFSCANNNHKNIFSNCRLTIFTQNVKIIFSDRGYFLVLIIGVKHCLTREYKYNSF